MGVNMHTSIELFERGEWKTIRDDTGAAVGPCAGATTECSATYPWLKTFTVSSGRKASIAVQESDYKNFDNNLAEDVEFLLRVRTFDYWSKDASNNIYQSIRIVFTHECRAS